MDIAQVCKEGVDTRLKETPCETKNHTYFLFVSGLSNLYKWFKTLDQERYSLLVGIISLIFSC